MKDTTPRQPTRAQVEAWQKKTWLSDYRSPGQPESATASEARKRHRPNDSRWGWSGYGKAEP